MGKYIKCRKCGRKGAYLKDNIKKKELVGIDEVCKYCGAKTKRSY